MPWIDVSEMQLLLLPNATIYKDVCTRDSKSPSIQVSPRASTIAFSTSGSTQSFPSARNVVPSTSLCPQ